MLGGINVAVGCGCWGGVCAGEALTPKVLVGFFTIKFRQLKRMRLKVAHAITEEKCGGLWKSARGATRRGQVEHRDSRRLGILKPRNRETTTHAGFKVHFHSGCMSSCTGKGVKRGACGKQASSVSVRPIAISLPRTPINGLSLCFQFNCNFFCVYCVFVCLLLTF